MYQLRTVTIEDAKTLFVWTNDPVTRQNSFQSRPVLWEEHISWLTKKLADENCYFFILTDGKTEFGTIRVECKNAESRITKDENFGLISFSIAPEHRGKGLGSKMLFLLEQTLRDAKFSLLIGEVKKENAASRKCFEANGYEEKKAIDGELIFSKRI